MLRMRTLIVDDEPLAREGLELALRDLDGVEIIGCCCDGPSAVQVIHEHRPDLVFLDIRMPGLDGFEVIEAVGPEKMPAVIFLTAYQEFALHAFRVDAIDYLLKPIDTDALHESVARARRRFLQQDLLDRAGQLRRLLDAVAANGPDSGNAERSAGPAPASERERPQDREPFRIAVRASGRVHLLDPADITWVEADGDYVTVHTSGKAHLVRSSMKGIEASLAPHGFRRIHRSSLVNLRCIRELIAHDSGDYRVVLQDGTELRMSRNYRDALYAALKASP